MLKLKVRAYDEEAEHMFYSDKKEGEYFFEFNDAGELRGYAIRPPRPSPDPMEPPEPYCDDYPVDLCTTLTDINTTNIYQNDILEWQGYKLKVHWGKHARFMVDKDNMTIATAQQSQVVGNMHENPLMYDN